MSPAKRPRWCWEAGPPTRPQPRTLPPT
jgi:hypothetical protein